MQELLGAVHETLATVAAAPISESDLNGSNNTNSNKRKGQTEPAASNSTSSSTNNKKKPKLNTNGNNAKVSPNKNSELALREDRAMEMLIAFVQERGHKAELVDGFRARVTRKGVNGRFDVNFYNAAGRRFRSMLEVGRILNIVGASDNNSKQQQPPRRRTKVSVGKDQEIEKKRIRKELEKLRKSHQRARKALDANSAATQSELAYPVDDDRLLLVSSEPASGSLVGAATTTCAAALVPDFAGFDGIPLHCTPEVLMVWDFLCTFERALSLAPISLDDFATALVFVPPDGHTGDDVLDPPVYLAEAHLGLLKLLFADKSSDEWWWSVLETDETEGIKIKDSVTDETGKEIMDRPVIRVKDMAATLTEVEDPLITSSWLSLLENSADGVAKRAQLKNTIRSALKLTTNKYVAAYLRKSLDVCKMSGTVLAQQALRWLVRRVREARPDLGEKSTNQDAVFKARTNVVDAVEKQMESLGSSAPSIAVDDVVSDLEYDDDESDESDDEEDEEEKDVDQNRSHIDTRDESERPASALPPKPLPTLVDLLLPPSKPAYNSEFVDAFSWPHLAGAAAARILHRKKRLINEIDDHIRESNALPRLAVSDRREREKLAASRSLTECEDHNHSSVESAIQHLCKGERYLALNAVERLCLLRLLVEASYDTSRVYEVVSGNYNQRTSAMKALEVEQRRAKREAKEKSSKDEAAARERLASDAREHFLDEKRDEIRQLNARSKEFSDDVIESLTDEDIIDFDDDIKADYEALPTPDSFNDKEVSQMVVRLQEEEAFETDALAVLTMSELIEKESRELEELEGQFSGFGGEDALVDESLDRETIRNLDRLRRDVERARSQALSLPDLRAKSLAQLKDAIEDGRIVVLRAAFNVAKKAKLMGTDDETGGVWAVDLMRDAGLELEKAKQNKRVLDAQKDLLAKRNKCFIRTEPMGQDRSGNRFWILSKKNDSGNDEDSRIWTETEFSIRQADDISGTSAPGYLDLSSDAAFVSVGAADVEEDFLPRDGVERFRLFSRREYHTSGLLATLAKHQWGCHSTEESIRALIKNVEPKGVHESELKTKLKELLEETLGADENEKQQGVELEELEAIDLEETDRIRFDGDEAVFIEAKDAASSVADIDCSAFEHLYSGMGANVRIRHAIDASKDSVTARYENGTVKAWKLSASRVGDRTGDSKVSVEEDNAISRTIEAPVWNVVTERGHIYWLQGNELTEGMSRFKKCTQGQGYFENDSSFFSYKNSIGRFCGKASEASYAASPYFFAKLMLKKEAELYPKLKTRNFDDNWGGQSGARSLWTNSMKDYAYDFQTVNQGLLTLENALFELTGEFRDYVNLQDHGKIEDLLTHPNSAFEIELESMEKNLPGLWNSPTSRAVFLFIVKGSKTTGFLSIALDLLYRNTMRYLLTHNLLHVRGGDSAVEASTTSSRNKRRQNAWQQQQDVW